LEDQDIKVVPLSKQFITNFSLQRPEFSFRVCHVELVVDKLPLEQFFFKSLDVLIILPVFEAYISLSFSKAGKIGPFKAVEPRDFHTPLIS
jgi:hypothetical protein